MSEPANDATTEPRRLPPTSSEVVVCVDNGAVSPTPHQVPIDRIKPYDRNPRQVPNAAYETIKQSVRQRGFRGVLSITRRPGDDDFMVAEGGNTALQIVKELYAETQDAHFATLPCRFEPWINESNTLIAHLIENDARGDLTFIDRAHAAHALRRLLEAETGTALSFRELASGLRERGYTIDHGSLVKMAYAIDTLYPCLPIAFRAGLGGAQVERIHKLETTLTQFLEHRQQSQTVINAAKQWYLSCLARYDNADLPYSLEPVQREVEHQVAELCDESLARVRADFSLIMMTGLPGQDAPPADPFIPRKQTAPVPQQPQLKPIDTGPASTEDAVTEADEGTVTPASASTLRSQQSPPKSTLPNDVKNLRGRLWTLATQLAQPHGLAECIRLCSSGCGFTVDLPESALFAGEYPASEVEAMRVILWWMLAGLADQWPYGADDIPSVASLEDARIYPAIRAAAEDDQATLAAVLDPRVGFPPSLDIASRQLFALLDERDYTRLVQMIDARRLLQGHVRRLGKPTVWAV
jgi:ParB family protein of integrating conjugative element (PFGI_1 class)